MNFITHVMPCHRHGHTCNNHACVNIKLWYQCKKARAWEYYGEKTCFIDSLITYKLHKINSEGVLVQCEPKLGFGLTKDSHGLITTQALIRKKILMYIVHLQLSMGPGFKRQKNPKIPKSHSQLGHFEVTYKLTLGKYNCLGNASPFSCSIWKIFYMLCQTLNIDLNVDFWVTI